MDNMKIFCFVNGIYSNQIGGGDIYFWNLFKNVPADLHIFGGYYTCKFLTTRDMNCSYSVYNTDVCIPEEGSDKGFKNQCRLLYNNTRRMFNTLELLNYISHDDIAYGMSDYFFDVIPLVLCKARRKIFYLGTIARKSTPLYWLSQRFSLMLFRIFCKGQIVTYSHPSMFTYLRSIGFKEYQLHYIPNGLDIETCNTIPDVKRIYDIIWTGRIHPQKGIEDLVDILRFLYWINLKICLIGEGGLEIKKRLLKDGLRDCDIYAPGIVSEQEKFRLLKSSKVFIFPSHYESFGISIGEALISGCNVVAYNLDCYSVYGYAASSYVECFDTIEFIRKTKSLLESPYNTYIPKNLYWPNIREKFYQLLK